MYTHLWICGKLSERLWQNRRCCRSLMKSLNGIHGIVVPKELARVFIFTILATSVGVFVVEIRSCRRRAAPPLLLRKLSSTPFPVSAGNWKRRWWQCLYRCVVEVCSRYDSDFWNLVSFHNHPKLKHINTRRKRSVSIWYKDRQNVNWGRRIWCKFWVFEFKLVG